MKATIKISTEEYTLEKNNLRINCYLSTFNLDGIDYAMIHLGGYQKLDKCLIAGEISEENLYLIAFSQAYYWGILVWNDTYISGRDKTEMILVRHQKIAKIYDTYEGATEQTVDVYHPEYHQNFCSVEEFKKVFDIEEEN